MSDFAQQLDFLLAGMQDVSGKPLSGAIVVTRNSANSAAKAVWEDRDKTLPSGLGKSQFNLNSDGMAEVFADGVYTVLIYDAADTGLTSPLHTFPGVSYSPFEGDPVEVDNVIVFSSISSMAAGVTVDGLAVYLAGRDTEGDGGEGHFHGIETASLTDADFSAIALDTLEGLYVAGSGGYWKRDYLGNVKFDWFGSEKANPADYDIFINGSSETFGSIPSIGTTNRDTYSILLAAGYAVDFGEGIYPFDAEVSAASTFFIRGAGRLKTLIWCPNSNFMHFSTSVGAEYPSIKDITIECSGSVILTEAHLVDAIQALILENSFFVSYASHTFWNDFTVAGGTGCPIYGSKITQVGVYAGPAMGCFYGWGSASNVFDNMVDLDKYFNKQNTNDKGITKALFFNSNVRDLCNSNISYSGLEYVYLTDRATTLNTFNAHHNSFETNANSFKAICKCDNDTSNIYIDTHSNRYNGVMTELGYHYIFITGNTYIKSTDSPTPLYGNNIRNLSDQFVRARTTLIDSGGTKYRLIYFEPRSSLDEGTHVAGKLMTPTLDLATLMGMESDFIADSSIISFLQHYKSYYSINGDTFPGHYSGTTGIRPTDQLYIGRVYFDNTLGIPIWVKTIVHTLVTAGSFVPTTQYAITSVGSTDFTLIGASSNTIGVIFTATGVGVGTGTASETDTVPVVTWVNGAGTTV